MNCNKRTKITLLSSPVREKNRFNRNKYNKVEWQRTISSVLFSFDQRTTNRASPPESNVSTPGVRPKSVVHEDTSMFPGNDRPLSNNMIIAGLVGLLLLLVALGNVFWEEPETEKRFESTRTLMDTYVSVTVYDTDEDRAEAAIDAAFQRMEDIVAIASRFNSS